MHLAAHTNLSCAATQLQAVQAAADRDSSYSKDFGRYGDDPLLRGADSATELTRNSSTVDLAAGTVRATAQRPGQTLLIHAYV